MVTIYENIILPAVSPISKCLFLSYRYDIQQRYFCILICVSLITIKHEVFRYLLIIYFLLCELLFFFFL